MDMMDIFQKDVFCKKQIAKRLPKQMFEEFELCKANNQPLSLQIADAIANAMKEWAIERGVTHFSHWFQPLNDITAQKQDSFLTVSDGKMVVGLSGKDLIKGEPDASSFPNGGLRSTFEARGYTVWDPLSPAFIKDGVLCIPTSFCSFRGEALDKKTPLLRSIDAINIAGKRLLKLFGKNPEKIVVNVGAEQEYFLIDKSLYQKRRDLIYTGKTLFGARPPKQQELKDHYYGSIDPKVAEFMKDLDLAFWKLGISSKTRHNEVAPRQYEFAPLFTSANLACDQNQLAMEVMKNIASKHGFCCLLNEKPFAYINGSGKHNNWSISTDDGQNLFDSGSDCQSNTLFLLGVCAVICAVDKHQDLLRIATCGVSNDLRLGGNEAPIATISLYLGEELTGILQAIADNRTYSKRAKCSVQIGRDILPKIQFDMTDRNRTSPFAFTGNKFEFRMCGASQCVADINTILNCIIAEQFDNFSNALEQCKDIQAEVQNIIKNTMHKHGKIIFNGNNYSAEWAKISKERNLLCLAHTPQAIALFDDKKNIALFEKYKIFSHEELLSRKNVLYTTYCNTLLIDALSMIDIVQKDIIPCAINYKNQLVTTIRHCKDCDIDAYCEKEIAKTLSQNINDANSIVCDLKGVVGIAKSITQLDKKADFLQERILPIIVNLREKCDAIEAQVGRDFWCMPTYADLLLG